MNGAREALATLRGRKTAAPLKPCGPRNTQRAYSELQLILDNGRQSRSHGVRSFDSHGL